MRRPSRRSEGELAEKASSAAQLLSPRVTVDRERLSAMTDDAADERDRPGAGDDAAAQEPTSVDLRTFQHAVEQRLSIVVLTDANGRIQYVNPKFTEVTGYASEETIGRHIADFGALPPEEQARLRETVRAGGHWQGGIG